MENRPGNCCITTSTALLTIGNKTCFYNWDEEQRWQLGGGAAFMNNLFHIVSVLDRKSSLKWVFVHKFLSKEMPHSRQGKKRGDCCAYHHIQVYH